MACSDILLVAATANVGPHSKKTLLVASLLSHCHCLPPLIYEAFRFFFFFFFFNFFFFLGKLLLSTDV